MSITGARHARGDRTSLYLVHKLDPKGTAQACWAMSWNRHPTLSPPPSSTPCRPPRLSTAINARTAFIDQASVSDMARGQGLH